MSMANNMEWARNVQKEYVLDVMITVKYTVKCGMWLHTVWLRMHFLQELFWCCAFIINAQFLNISVLYLDLQIHYNINEIF